MRHRHVLMATALNISITPSPLSALASHSIAMPFSFANARASSLRTARLVSRSFLFPTNTMLMFGDACFCSSLTQNLAFSNYAVDVMSYTTTAAPAPR